MVRVYYFHINPTDELTHDLSSLQVSQDIIEILTTPQLWVRRVSEHALLRRDEMIKQMKVTFLANLGALYVGDDNNTDAIKKVILDMLGEPPWTTTTFDKCWHIERYESDENYDEVIAAITPQDWKRVHSEDTVTSQ